VRSGDVGAGAAGRGVRPAGAPAGEALAGIIILVVSLSLLTCMGSALVMWGERVASWKMIPVAMFALLGIYATLWGPAGLRRR
jgi:hypothetical protein